MRILTLAVVVSVSVFAGCTTYDFQRVEPFAVAVEGGPQPRFGTAPRPRLMLVVDKSGSMAFDTTAEQPCGTTAGCISRWTALKDAMDAFLTSGGTEAHLGMVPFPDDKAGNQCHPASLSTIATWGVQLDTSAEDDVATRQVTADGIRAALARLTPNGGTPTGATLTALADYPELVTPGDRAPYVLLLTDGAPNCNPAFEQMTADCFCLQGNTLTPANMCGGPGLNGCLDEDGAVAAIDALRAKGVKTIVVGFGPATSSGTGAATLSAMARAGGFQRPCTADADCGAGDSCSIDTLSPCGAPMKACARPDFQASSAADLGRVLDDVRKSIVCENPCLVHLSSQPPSALWISVKVDGQRQAPGPDTWRYLEGPNQVEFTGATCTAIRAATSESPLIVDIRVATEL